MLSFAGCLLAASMVVGQAEQAAVSANDLAPGILKYFPGKWEIKAEDGTVLGTAHWQVVSGGKALAGPGTSVEHGDTHGLAGWDAKAEKWLHNWFQKDGSYGHLEVTGLKDDTYIGRVTQVAPNGNATTTDWRNKIIELYREDNLKLSQDYHLALKDYGYPVL